MKLRTIDIVILLSLGLLAITRASWGLHKDIFIDLSTAKSVTGKVVYAEIKEIEKFTLKVKKYATVFSIRLKNLNENFAVDRGADAYNYLNSQIKVGDTIRIWYRPVTGDINTRVFQVEKNGRILASADGYKSNELGMIVFAFFFGTILIGGTVLWYIKKRAKT